MYRDASGRSEPGRFLRDNVIGLLKLSKVMLSKVSSGKSGEAPAKLRRSCAEAPPNGSPRPPEFRYMLPMYMGSICIHALLSMNSPSLSCWVHEFPSLPPSTWCRCTDFMLRRFTSDTKSSSVDAVASGELPGLQKRI